MSAKIDFHLHQSTCGAAKFRLISHWLIIGQVSQWLGLVGHFGNAKPTVSFRPQEKDTSFETAKMIELLVILQRDKKRHDKVPNPHARLPYISRVSSSTYTRETPERRKTEIVKVWKSCPHNSPKSATGGRCSSVCFPTKTLVLVCN